MFKISDHVTFDTKGRAICPACIIAKGTEHSGKNLSLVGTEGAYKCHRGCTSKEIRGAIGKPVDRVIPTALTKPAPNVIVTTEKIEDAHTALLKNNEAMGWLDDRGIDRAAVARHKLGLVRSKQGERFIPSISIPIPSDGKGNFYQKKRLAPWVPDCKRPEDWKAWSQYGIPQMVYFTHKPENAIETWLCEGEWDAICLATALKKNPQIAVACFTCGAGNVPPDDELDRLPGKVTIFYDRDEPGQKGALKVQDRLKDRAYIAIVPDVAGDEDLTPEGWDISDHLGIRPIEALEQLAIAADYATPWSTPKRVNPLRSRLQTNDEYMESAQDYVEWLVPDILTQDELFILGMPPRGGKSLFCLTLAKAIASGGHFLDRPTTQGSVIYVNMEDAPTKVKQRQTAQGWSEGLPVYWMEKFKLSELDDLKELADEIPDLRLVVLDTFSRIRDDNQKESSAELGKLLEPLQEWAKDRGICILITHHTGKTNSDHPSADPFDSLRGSSSIRATCRGAIVIVPSESGYRLLAENGYSDRLDINVKINSENLQWKMLGNWTPRIDGPMKEQILDFLNLHSHATIAEIARDLNFNAGSVGTIMSRLHRDDLVGKKGGLGRKSATYFRSSNLLQLCYSELEHPNPDPVSDTSLLQQDILRGVSPEKVCIGAKSDQNLDHFSKNTPTQVKVLEQSCKPDPVSDVCSNTENESWSKLEQAKPEKEEEWVYWEKVKTVVKVTKKRGEFAWIKVPGQKNIEKVLIAELGEK